MNPFRETRMSGNGMNLQLKVISCDDTKELDSAYALIARFSWSQDELASIDLMSELINKCEFRPALYDGSEMVGFVTVGTGASPDKIDNDQLWIGCLVIHPAYRHGGKHWRTLYSACLEFARADGSLETAVRRRLYSCSETPSVQRALIREGWIHRRTAEILGDDGKEIGEKTEVFEFIM